MSTTPDDIAPWERSGGFRRDPEPHRADRLAALGLAADLLAAFAVFCPPACLVPVGLALLTRRLSERDLAEMDAGRMDRQGRPRTEYARRLARGALRAVCGGLAFWAVAVLAWLIGMATGWHFWR